MYFYYKICSKPLKILFYIKSPQNSLSVQYLVMVLSRVQLCYSKKDQNSNYITERTRS